MAAKHGRWARGMTQTCTVRSNERSLRKGRACVVKVCEFSSQIPLPQTTGRDELLCGGTIRNIFKGLTRAFLKSTSHFLRSSPFFAKTPRTTQLLASVYLQQLTLSKKLSVMHCPLCSSLDVKPLHRHSCWTLFLAGKSTPQIMAVSSENCNVRTWI